MWAVGMQCFIAYQEPVEKGGSWIHDNRKILRNYATSWMPLDVLTAIPIDVILAAYEHFHGQSTASGVGDDQAVAITQAGASTLRIVRMMRLLKLIRIVRTSRIFKRCKCHSIRSASLVLLEPDCISN